MQKQYIAIGVLTSILVAAWIARALFFKAIPRDWAYLYWMTLSTCALIVIALCVDSLLKGRKKGVAAPGRFGRTDENNRRSSFRVTYPEDLRPRLIVEHVDDVAIRHLEFAVMDLSEEGICFMEDGSLGKAKKLSGRVVFNSGESISVAFDIVRRQGYRISVRLQHSLAWRTLIREQQRMMPRHKKT